MTDKELKKIVERIFSDVKPVKHRRDPPGEPQSPERLAWLENIFKEATKEPVIPEIIEPRKTPAEKQKP